MKVSRKAQPITQLDWLRAIVFPQRSSDEEKAFRAYYQGRTLPMARTGAIISILLISAVCLLDFVYLPRELAEDLLQFRLATQIAVLGIPLAISFARPSNPVIPYSFMLAVAVCGVSTIAVGVKAAQAGVQFVAWGTIFATVIGYLVFGLRFRLAAFAGWPLLLTYVGVALYINLPFEKVAYGTMFLAFTNIVGMYTNFLLEKDARQLFHQEMMMRELAQTDGLTGIHNRRSFDEHLSDVWRQAHREDHLVAVLLIDIDHFKLYNDCYGHQLGDICIQAVADVLASSVKRPLDQVARYGGEEFAIVLYNPTHVFVSGFADLLVERVHELAIEHKASDVTAHVTVSVGAAVARPVESRVPSAIVRSADDALYESKAQGRNRATVLYLDEDLRATKTLRIINM